MNHSRVIFSRPACTNWDKDIHVHQHDQAPTILLFIKHNLNYNIYHVWKHYHLLIKIYKMTLFVDASVNQSIEQSHWQGLPVFQTAFLLSLTVFTRVRRFNIDWPPWAPGELRPPAFCRALAFCCWSGSWSLTIPPARTPSVVFSPLLLPFV